MLGITPLCSARARETTCPHARQVAALVLSSLLLWPPCLRPGGVLYELLAWKVCSQSLGFPLWLMPCLGLLHTCTCNTAACVPLDGWRAWLQRLPPPNWPALLCNPAQIPWAGSEFWEVRWHCVAWHAWGSCCHTLHALTFPSLAAVLAVLAMMRAHVPPSPPFAGWVLAFSARQAG